MSKENDLTESEVVEVVSERFEKDEVELSKEHIENLMKFAPHIKEMFEKVADLTNRSGQNVFDVLKEIISVYKDELKRDDLTQEQREAIYDRIDNHAKNAREQDDTNKRFISGLMGVTLTALVGGAVKFGPKIVKGLLKK